jgi:tetratricopeptide (TPR) repeat protein
LDRLADADLLFVEGAPPLAIYRFKHALIQDAAYESLLKSRRQPLHRRVAEVLLDNVTAPAEPELLAHHFTQAGHTEAAIEWWSKAGRRSLERSALVEAAEQFTRALDQIATLPATPALRRRQIELQVALITPLLHVKGFTAPETKAAVERARQLIEQAEVLGEPPEDSLLLFSALYGFWVTNFLAFNGDVVREIAAQFLALAEKQGGTVPLMIGHRVVGLSLLCAGDMAEGRAHYDQAIALYDSAAHRPLAARFLADIGVAILSYRSLALWTLGYPESALADAEHALGDAREMGQAATLLLALGGARAWILILCGNYAAASAHKPTSLSLWRSKRGPCSGRRSEYSTKVACWP